MAVDEVVDRIGGRFRVLVVRSVTGLRKDQELQGAVLPIELEPILHRENQIRLGCCDAQWTLHCLQLVFSYEAWVG